MKEELRPHTVERLSEMTRDEVDGLPYGFIVLNPEGEVLLYNRYEQEMSRVPSDRVVGRNFFREIAPCTRVEAFFGRFRVLTQQPPGSTDSFSFRFHFLHGAQDVFVQLASAPGDRVLMTVHRRSVAEVQEVRPTTVRQELERGCLNGPLGVLFPLGWDQITGLFARIGARVARELGSESGSALARTAERTATTTGVGSLDQAPLLLAAGALDEALARMGLGRLALDLSALPSRIACFVRPPVESTSVGVAAFYEGLIETAVSAALGSSLVAKCIEGAELEAIPWRFVLVPNHAAHELVTRPGERPDDLARQMGLLEGNAETVGPHE